MRAETINFTRGGDPYKKLGVGGHSTGALAIKAARERASTVVQYYDSMNLQSQYEPFLLEVWDNNENEIKDRIIKYMSEYHFETRYQVFSYDDIGKLAPKIYDFITENIDDFTRPYDNYYVGHTSLENIEFGEQSEEITPFEVPYFEEQGFYVSDSIATFNVSGGLHVDLLGGDLDFDELLEASSSVGIGSGGRGGYGSGNMMTPQSKRGYAHAREVEEDDEEWLDLEDLSGEFMDESENFTRGGDPYKKMRIGQYSEDEIKDVIFNKGYKILMDDGTKDYEYFSNNQGEAYSKLYNILEEMFPDQELIPEVVDKIIEHYESYLRDINYDRLGESNNFTRGGDTYKKLGIGSHVREVVSFKNSGGEPMTIHVQDNSFKLAHMDVRVEFDEIKYKDSKLDDTRTIRVYVDGDKSDMKGFMIIPADYEFTVPLKKIIQVNGKSEFDPASASKTYSAYGYPLAQDDDHLKELKTKYSYWHISHMDFNETDKNPYAAIAKMILYTY